jgi:hypothetical protein
MPGTGTGVHGAGQLESLEPNRSATRPANLIKSEHFSNCPLLFFEQARTSFRQPVISTVTQGLPARLPIYVVGNGPL